MKIRFTPEWHMEVLLENPLEHEIWPCLVNDARSLGEDSLSDALGPDFEDESFETWQEWIQPEVEIYFMEQIHFVKKSTRQIEKNVFLVPSHQVFAWYGAINQARFALESIFQFSRDEIPLDSDERDLFIENWPLEKQASYQRYCFYNWIQGVILENLIAQANFPEASPLKTVESTTANSSSLPLQPTNLTSSEKKEVPLPPAPTLEEKKEKKASPSKEKKKTSKPASPKKNKQAPSPKSERTPASSEPKKPRTPKKKKSTGEDEDDYTQPDLF